MPPCRLAPLLLALGVALPGLAACSSAAAPDAGADLGTDAGTPDAALPDGGPGTDGGAGADAGGGDGGLGAALSAMGFDVAPGTYEFAMLDCCAAVTCFGNNPSSPYGEWFLPRGPGQTAANTGERADGTSATWRLREDEAVLYVGPTPPHAGYFGYTPYVFDRAPATGTMRDVVFTSLGDTVNDDVVHTAGGTGAPFATETVVLVTANSTTQAMAHAALAAAGIPSSEINDVVLPEAELHMGLDAGADTLAMLVRVALFDTDAEKAAYLAAPGGTVLRLTPHVAFPVAPLAVPAGRVRGSGTDESAYAADVDALRDAIIAAHAGVTATPLAGHDLTPDPAACLAGTRNCNGDNRDAVYTSLLPFRLMDGDQLVVYGVDHHASGKATYANVSVYDTAKLFGVASVDSRSYPGSADDYLPGDPRDAHLFAWTFARHCPSGATHCTEIPDACPGVPAAVPADFTSRAYLDPATHTGPLAGELLLDRAVLFR